MPDDPARYLREHAHYDEDLPFWTAAAARLGSPVLDLGCAAGRVALPLARAGAEVWAFDRSEGMLAALTAHAAAEDPQVAARVRPVAGDMRALSLPVRFPLAIAAMNTLQALLAPDDQLACLSAVREHLTPSGEMVFDVALPDLGDITDHIGVVRRTGEHLDPGTGATLAHSAWYEDFDPLTQTLAFTLQVDEIAPDGGLSRRLRRHEVHVFLPSELGHLLARAGLDVIAVYGDFAGGPVTEGCERQVYRCRAA